MASIQTKELVTSTIIEDVPEVTLWAYYLSTEAAFAAAGGLRQLALDPGSTVNGGLDTIGLEIDGGSPQYVNVLESGLYAITAEFYTYGAVFNSIKGQVVYTPAPGGVVPSLFASQRAPYSADEGGAAWTSSPTWYLEETGTIDCRFDPEGNATDTTCGFSLYIAKLG